jgi:hypothetical protein
MVAKILLCNNRGETLRCCRSQIVARTVEFGLVDDPVVGAYDLGIASAVGVLPLGSTDVLTHLQELDHFHPTCRPPRFLYSNSSTLGIELLPNPG